MLTLPFPSKAIVRLALSGVIFASFSIVSATGKAQTLGPLASSTIINHKTELAGAPNDVLTFQQFNPALGNLIDVVISVTGGLNSLETVQNSALTSSRGSVSTISTLTLTDPQSLISMQASILTNFFSYTLSPGQSLTSPNLTGSKTATGTFTASNILAEFTGLGTVQTPVTTFTQSFLGNSGGNTTASQITTANATGTITYHYQTGTPGGGLGPASTPEPGITAILGAVMVTGLVAFRRRKQN
jgi:hypothetical protein